MPISLTTRHLTEMIAKNSSSTYGSSSSTVQRADNPQAAQEMAKSLEEKK